MPVSISGTNGVTFPDSSLQAAAASPYVLKNRIINGAMVIDQRRAGASVTIPATTITYTVDRFFCYATQASKYSVQQNAGSVTPPVGFTNYAGITSLSAYSVTSTDEFNYAQTIEGFNIADLAWGTANAQAVTLSFWVRSSLTGTFGGSLKNNGNARSYPFSYTISSANTWEQKIITVAGDTTGTWLTNNGNGLTITFGLGQGSTFSGTASSWQTGNFTNVTGATSVVGTSGATFYITGVQLEIGSSATPFERRLYNQELANCQRYYYKNSVDGSTPYGSSFNTATTAARGLVCFPVQMRTAPTALETNGTAADYSVFHGSSTATVCNAVPSYNISSTSLAQISFTVASGLTVGQGSQMRGQNAGFLAWSAEL
jgi:hypothetical protein